MSENNASAKITGNHIMMTLAKMAVCWIIILLIFGTTNGEELVEFDVTETK